MNDLNRLKERYTIFNAWRDLGLPGHAGRSCRSPFPGEHKNEDRNPSFSVFENGRKWHDFATGEGGDVLDLIAKVRGWDASQVIRFIKDRLGVEEYQAQAVKPCSTPTSKLPPLRPPTKAEMAALSEHRGFNPNALQLAMERGFLHFTTLWGQSAWAITDCRRQMIEFRQTSGEYWPACGSLPERKCHCIGQGKDWPIGTCESEPYERIALVEGAPDLLACFHFLIVEGKENKVAPVAILGASNHRLSPHALTNFRGKRVCIYSHVDMAGRKATRKWAIQLRDAGALVTAFDLSGIVMTDGSEGKDLADLCRINPDCFELERKFSEILP